MTTELTPDPFTIAFDQFTDPGATATATIPETPAPETPETPAPVAETPAPVMPETPETPAPVVETPVAAAPVTPEPPVDPALQRLMDLIRNAPAPAPVEAPAPAAPAPDPAATLGQYNDDERQLLENYEKEWPEVAGAEALRRRAEYERLVHHVFAEVSKAYAPMVQVVEQLASQYHRQQLATAVPQYSDTLQDEVKTWVGQQPKYLQNAYLHVIEEGTVEEVSDLVQRFRQATGGGAVGTGAPNVPSPAPARTETELPTATKQAVAALAPVSSKRSAVGTGLEMSDFNSAFDVFADKV
jgi:hypothetical protein